MVEINVPDTASTVDVEFTLPDGTVVGMREPTGYDLTKALKAIPANAAPTDQTYALIAQVSLFNGKPKRFEEVRAMKLRVLNLIMRHFGGLVTPDAPLPEMGPEEEMPPESLQ